MKKMLLLFVMISLFSITGCAKDKKSSAKKSAEAKVVKSVEKGAKKLEVLPQNYVESIKKTVGVIKHKMSVLIFVDKDDDASKTAISLFHDLNVILGDSVQYSVVKSDNKDMIKKYDVKYFPTIVYLDYKGKDHGVYFIGTPGGHELNSVLAALSFFVQDSPNLPRDVDSIVRTIDKPLKIEAMVSAHCPYCPKAAISAHAFAYINDNIKGYNVDAGQAPELSKKYNVSSVPLIVYQEGNATDLGAVPLPTMIESIKKAMK